MEIAIRIVELLLIWIIGFMVGMGTMQVICEKHHPQQYSFFNFSEYAWDGNPGAESQHYRIDTTPLKESATL